MNIHSKSQNSGQERAQTEPKELKKAQTDIAEHV